MCSRTGAATRGVEANTDSTRAVAALGTSVRISVMMYAKSCRGSELWERFVVFKVTSVTSVTSVPNMVSGVRNAVFSKVLRSSITLSITRADF
eukprot:3225869-Prymnesium_polylepis.1